MRRARAGLLLAIALVLLAIGAAYHWRRSRQAREVPPAPPRLPPDTAALSSEWTYTQYAGQRPLVEVRASKMRQFRSPDQIQLDNVRLRIFDADAGTYHLVQCQRAVFNLARVELASEGEADITLHLSLAQSPEKPRVRIRTSGLRLDVRTGKVTTEQTVRFEFGSSRGVSVGATYEPGWHELRLHRDVMLDWPGASPNSPPLHLEAASLVYKDDQDKVYLPAPVRFRRGGFLLQASQAVVTLNRGSLERIDAEKAQGQHDYPPIEVRYAADQLVVEFGPNFQLRKVVGRGLAQLRATSKGAIKQLRSEQLFLDFAGEGGETRLAAALALEKAELRSWLETETEARRAFRQLRSEVIKLVMAPGGREIQAIETHAPAQLVVGQAGSEEQLTVEAERLWLYYAPGNRLRQLRAARARTLQETRPTATEQRVPIVTQSDDLLAEFDATGRVIQRIEQWGRFRFEQGPRKAWANKAEFDQQTNRVTLTEQARYEDPQLRLRAQQIQWVRDQSRLEANGQVEAAWLGPSSPKKTEAGPLDFDRPIYGAAARLWTEEQQTRIFLEGQAIVWQAGHRILAHRIEVDRSTQRLTARGDVDCRFTLEEAKAKPATARLIRVRAPELDYDGQARRARYAGGVRLEQQDLQIEAEKLHVMFASKPEVDGSSSAASRVEQLIAEGRAVIRRQLGASRRILAQAERAEYDVSRDRTRLIGGRPRLEDSTKGVTEGHELIYLARDDKLLVDGTEQQPALSRLRR